MPAGSGEPNDVTAGPGGNLWFVQQGSSARVGRMTTSGTLTQYPPPTPVSDPNQIAAGADGNLWFTEQQAHKIGRMAPP
jgi:virginiamycin B lyase